MTPARRLRRQHNLTHVEISEENVTISDELLGKGGFSSVYIADHNGRNAAAKVNDFRPRPQTSRRIRTPSRSASHTLDVSRPW